MTSTRFYSSVIAADRLIESAVVLRTFVPVGAERVDRIVQVEGYDAKTVAVDQIVLSETVNCRVGRTRMLHPDAHAFELLFDQWLPIGQPYTFSYRHDVPPAYQGEPTLAQPETETVIGVRTLCPMVSVEVTFDRSCLPAAVWRVEKPYINVRPCRSNR